VVLFRNGEKEPEIPCCTHSASQLYESAHSFDYAALLKVD
jgi:hypothetical protein